MIEATSCGGVVIHRGKILALYKSYRNRYEGWVLPKGTVEKGETFEQTALREVMEEAGVRASIVKYIGKSQYNFTVPEDVVMKEVHWYLMIADNYHSKPQREEYFVDSGLCTSTISFMRSIIFSVFPTRSISWNRPIRSIWKCEVKASGRNSRSIFNNRTGLCTYAALFGIIAQARADSAEMDEKLLHRK